MQVVRIFFALMRENWLRVKEQVHQYDKILRENIENAGHFGGFWDQRS